MLVAICTCLRGPSSHSKILTNSAAVACLVQAVVMVSLQLAAMQNTYMHIISLATDQYVYISRDAPTIQHSTGTALLLWRVLRTLSS